MKYFTLILPLLLLAIPSSLPAVEKPIVLWPEGAPGALGTAPKDIPTLSWEGISGQRYVYARYFDQQPAYEFLHDLETDRDELKNYATDPAHAEASQKMRGMRKAAAKKAAGQKAKAE